MLFSLAHKHKHMHKKNKHVRFSYAYVYAYALMLMLMTLCASENSIRQISGFVLLMFLLMLTLMSRVFSLVMLMLCLCASENQPLLNEQLPSRPGEILRVFRGKVFKREPRKVCKIPYKSFRFCGLSTQSIQTLYFR